jgi:hypothetical protein
MCAPPKKRTEKKGTETRNREQKRTEKKGEQPTGHSGKR